MKSLFHLYANDDTYGPGTDLAMALLGIFILSTAITKKNDAETFSRFLTISKNQIEVITDLASSYHTKYTMDSANTYLINPEFGLNPGITIENEPVTQQFSFGESLLFDPGEAKLKDEGEKLMVNLGNIIKSHLAYIREIQIQGHADTVPPRTLVRAFKSNMELASARATSVFEFLKNQSGLDPSSTLMSIVSYGEFKPIQRKDNMTEWNRDKLNEANNTNDKRSKNRRIEILLFYK